jgi:hypothetical protein
VLVPDASLRRCIQKRESCEFHCTYHALFVTTVICTQRVWTATASYLAGASGNIGRTCALAFLDPLDRLIHGLWYQESLRCWLKDVNGIHLSGSTAEREKTAEPNQCVNVVVHICAMACMAAPTSAKGY